jgi:hypothetical protein
MEFQTPAQSPSVTTKAVVLSLALGLPLILPVHVCVSLAIFHSVCFFSVDDQHPFVIISLSAKSLHNTHTHTVAHAHTNTYTIEYQYLRYNSPLVIPLNVMVHSTQ